MTTYTVTYKTAKDFFWKKIKNVQGDGIIPNYPVPTRYFHLGDESRVEVPIEGTTFKFSKERFIVVKKNMEREANQDIRTS